MVNRIVLSLIIFISYSFLIQSCASKTPESPSKMKALIIDGDNNHGIWPKTTLMMKDFLEETGLFEVAIARTTYTYQGPHHNVELGDRKIEFLLDEYPLPDGSSSTPLSEHRSDPNFKPNFEEYDVVLSNFGWEAAAWPDETKSALESYLNNGGGLVIVHAANNSFGDWTNYNKMIGLGGWGGRTEKDGPYVFYNDYGELITDPGPGQCGSHGPQFEFVITTRAADHPIMKGLPSVWMHTKDEMYDRLRGPAENMTVLATAYSDVEGNGPPWNKEVKGSGRHEPMLMAITYGEGRIFHTALGHMDYSMECVGFITTLQRGAEWAATGEVTQSIPEDFPTKEKVSSRSWTK